MAVDFIIYMLGRYKWGFLFGFIILVDYILFCIVLIDVIEQNDNGSDRLVYHIQVFCSGLVWCLSPEIYQDS